MPLQRNKKQSPRRSSLKYISMPARRRSYDLKQRRQAGFWKKIPDEVLAAWLISQNRFLGSESVSMLEATITKYPEYFPWEIKYRSIPKEVHDAYNREANGEWFEFKANKGTPAILTGQQYHDANMGLIQYVEKKGMVAYSSLKNFTMNDMLEWVRRMDKADDEKRKRLKAEISIWDKHYKPYGLEYRKDLYG